MIFIGISKSNFYLICFTPLNGEIMVASNKDTLSISTITSKLNVVRNQHDTGKMESQEQTNKGGGEDNNQLSTDNTEKSEKKKFTLKQKLALISLALVDFMCYCSMSIMAPFFPREASIKGMSDTVSGFVFSFYALIMFVSSPVFGKIIPKVGEKSMFLSGIVLSGICSILFGLLEYVENYTLFAFLSFFIRGLEALGASAYSTASYVLIVNIFPDHIGTVRGTLETFVGLGMSAGPAIGGFLFSLGGFGLPFYVVGLISLVIIPLNGWLLPPSKKSPTNRKSGSIIQLIKIPGVIITGLVIMTVSITWSFLDPTLEPHLRQFNLTPENVGLLFLLISAMYGISSPGWGVLADRINNHWSMMVIGLFFSCIGLLILGPSPLLPFLDGSVWIIIVALSLLGLAVALALLPTFEAVLVYAVSGGLEDNIATQGIVAGMWSCAYSLGEVVGPSAGGLLLQAYGFPVASTTIAVANFVLVIVCLIYYGGENKTNKCKTQPFENELEGSWRTYVVKPESDHNKERF
ncbi:hypothetical protein CBL_06206 [Carabus blaptoides fortunei]